MHELMQERAVPVGVTSVGDDRSGEMRRVNSGMAATLAPGASWRKSRHSNPTGNCVEVAELADGCIAIRNSRHPGGPALLYTRAEMAAFIHGVKRGEFDDVVDAVATTTEENQLDGVRRLRV
jgi:hypothetical protein